MISGLVVGFIWGVGSMIGYGAVYAYFQCEYPTIADQGRRGDRMMALFGATLGPIGILALCVFFRWKFQKNIFRHGLRY